MWNILGEGPLKRSDEADDEAVILLFGADGLDEGPLAWQERALCAQTDPEAFFPEKGGSTREAKRVCATCEVREAASMRRTTSGGRVWAATARSVRSRYGVTPQETTTAKVCSPSAEAWAAEGAADVIRHAA